MRAIVVQLSLGYELRPPASFRATCAEPFRRDPNDPLPETVDIQHCDKIVETMERRGL